MAAPWSFPMCRYCAVSGGKRTELGGIRWSRTGSIIARVSEPMQGKIAFRIEVSETASREFDSRQLHSTVRLSLIAGHERASGRGSRGLRGHLWRVQTGLGKQGLWQGWERLPEAVPDVLRDADVDLGRGHVGVARPAPDLQGGVPQTAHVERVLPREGRLDERGDCPKARR